MDEDRRWWKRRSFGHQVEYCFGAEEMRAAGENLGPGGMFLATFACRAVGERMPVEFPMNGRRVGCEAEVRWLRPYNSRALDRMPGMGLRFLNLDDAVRDEIERFVAARAT